jgi:CxxC-x17-CxxC domain-containing protein
MSQTDTRLICRDCAQPFIFSVDEQRIFASQGLEHAPSRCTRCREERKIRQEQTGGRRHMPSFRDRREPFAMTIVCSACGTSAPVPFRMRASRLVFCSPCYEQRRNAGVSP